MEDNALIWFGFGALVAYLYFRHHDGGDCGCGGGSAPASSGVDFDFGFSVGSSSCGLPGTC